MKFEITSKDEQGNVVFAGTFNQQEASFILEVGVSYLLANGALPFLAEEPVSISPSTNTVQ